MSTITSEQPEFNNRWGSNFLVTYFNLHDNANLADLESKFPDFLSAHMNDDNDYYKLYLQPLKDVHLGSMSVEHDYHNYRKFNVYYLCSMMLKNCIYNSFKFKFQSAEFKNLYKLLSNFSASF